MLEKKGYFGVYLLITRVSVLGDLDYRNLTGNVIIVIVYSFHGIQENFIDLTIFNSHTTPFNLASCIKAVVSLGPLYFKWPFSLRVFIILGSVIRSPS